MDSSRNCRGRFTNKKKSILYKNRKGLISKINSGRSEVHDDHTYANFTQEYIEPADIGAETEINDVVDEDWRKGRRIVSLGTLADQLDQCTKCFQGPLRLSLCEESRQFGLGTILYVPCLFCGHKNSVSTDTKHSTGNQLGPRRCWDVNTKVAVGMLDAGIGERQVNALLTAMNVPPIHHKSLKEREREVGEALEKVAKRSCEEAIIEEKTLCNIENTQPKICFDGGWQKRGTGRSYNSLTGHATAIGKQSGKVLSYGVCHKRCRVCVSARKRGVRAKPHSCRKNWSGSSKAMESHLAVKCVEQLKKKDFQVKSIIMDDDTVTMKKLSAEVDINITKQSDRNHVKKNFGNELYKLQKTHKGFSTKTVQYFQKCFSYACSQNTDEAKLKQNLRAIVPHAFGEHAGCGEWCNFKQSPDTYKHKTLPRDLEGDQLKKDLTEIFERQIIQANKLVNMDSSNKNESINHMIATKAPKVNHYGDSESLDFRVASAVCQKNEGHGYISQVNEKLLLSPSHQAQKRAAILDKQREKKADQNRLKSAKLRRLQLKEERHVSSSSSELREGTTYSSGIADHVQEMDITVIPPAPISAAPFPQPTSDVLSVETFDIETTGLGKEADLVQLSAICASGNKFNKYILPTKPMTPGAQEVTKIAVNGNKILVNGVEVQSCSKFEALSEFIKFLQLQPGQIILAGHNSFRFDAPRLIKALEDVQLFDSFCSCVVGFVDTLILFRSKWPNMTNYKQETLVLSLLHVNYNAHDALQDVVYLQKLLTVSHLDVQELYMNSKAPSWFKSRETEREKAGELHHQIGNDYVSKLTCIKIIESGLTYDHLVLAYARGGSKGLELLCKEKNENGVPRVTENGSVIKRLAKHFTVIKYS